jgi:site-specific DNA recombinase
MILGYCRVSTAEQAADERTSMANQERVIRALATMRGAKGFEIALFNDPGVSGTIALYNRPAGKEMLEAAKKGDTICATKLDRLFRSASDALNTAEDLKKRGIDLILIDLGTDPVTSNGTAKLFFGLLAMIAEFERERIAERIDQGRKDKKANGGAISGIAPYGYLKVGKGAKSTVRKHPTEQQVFQLVIANRDLPSYRICKKLNESGLTNRRGGKFQITQVQRMLARLGNS